MLETHRRKRDRDRAVPQDATDRVLLDAQLGRSKFLGKAPDFLDFKILVKSQKS